MEPQQGRKYRHFEGDTYRVLYIGTHTETSEQLVIYQNITKDFEEIKASPLEIFTGKVENKKGKLVKRFELED